MSSLDLELTRQRPILIYDGDCPFCRNYIAFLRLRTRFPDLELLNAREIPDAVNALRAKGFEINDSMILLEKDNVYWGSIVIQYLARLPDRNSAFTKINRMMLGHPFLAKSLYPILVRLRKFYFKLFRKQLIE